MAKDYFEEFERCKQLLRMRGWLIDVTSISKAEVLPEWNESGLVVDIKKTPAYEHLACYISCYRHSKYPRFIALQEICTSCYRHYKYPRFIALEGICWSYNWLIQQTPSNFKSKQTYVNFYFIKHRVEEFIKHVTGYRPHVRQEASLIAALLIPTLQINKMSVGLQRPFALYFGGENEH